MPFLLYRFLAMIYKCSAPIFLPQTQPTLLTNTDAYDLFHKVNGDLFYLLDSYTNLIALFNDSIHDLFRIPSYAREDVLTLISE